MADELRRKNPRDSPSRRRIRRGLVIEDAEDGENVSASIDMEANEDDVTDFTARTNKVMNGFAREIGPEMRRIGGKPV
jgi:hypothetical protein